jgi:hypothetical protein
VRTYQAQLVPQRLNEARSKTKQSWKMQVNVSKLILSNWNDWNTNQYPNAMLKYIVRAYFWKKIALLNSFVRLYVCPFVRRSICPSVCSSVGTLFFLHLSTNDLQILVSKRTVSIYEEYGWVFRSKAQELWDWAQIRNLSN